MSAAVKSRILQALASGDHHWSCLRCRGSTEATHVRREHRGNMYYDAGLCTKHTAVYAEKHGLPWCKTCQQMPHFCKNCDQETGHFGAKPSLTCDECDPTVRVNEVQS